MKFQIQSGSLSSMLPIQHNPLIVPVQSQTRHLRLLSQSAAAPTFKKPSFSAFILSSIAYDDLAQLTSTSMLYLCICAMIQCSAVP